jgi:endonuclease YncB( thermonuclease family)
MKKLLITILIAGFCTLTIGAQSALNGTVVEVIDGKTIVMLTSAGRITAQLQYVEVPESDEPLFAVTRDHLATLVNGKVVDLKPRRIVGGKTVGRVTLDGVDLSLQLVRDGAAWHEPKEISGQHPQDAADYEANQTLAKNEKRGVWSGAILKTPWQVRSEKEQSQRALESARRLSRPTPVGVGEFHSDTRRPSGNHAPIVMSQRAQMNNWVSVFSGAKQEGYGLHTYADPKGRFNTVYTSASFFDFGSTAGTERLECRLGFVSMNRYGGGRNTFHLIGFRAISESYRFSNARSRLTFFVDGRSIALGAPYGWRRNGAIGAEEIMIYQIRWATIKKIVDAKNVELRIGKTARAPLSNEARELFKQLVTATG